MTLLRPGAVVIGSGVVSLGVINDLVADGISVTHISPKSCDLALRSRWPIEKIVLQDSCRPAEQLLKILDERSDDWKGACLLPTTDPLLRIVSKNLKDLEDDYVTPVLPWTRLFPIVNKAELYARAQEAGIPAPKVLYGASPDNAVSWAETIKYPVIIKPSQTPEFFRVFNGKVLLANNAAELEEQLDQVSRHELDVMISEIIPGPPGNLKAYRSYIDRDGQIRAEMCSEKVRCHPPEYGVGIVQRTVPLDDELCRLGRSLLSALQFRGYSTIEFKFDERDQVFKLIEINPRPAMVQRLFRKAGLNFAKLTVDDLQGRAIAANHSYKPGVYCIHNSADLYHLRRFFRRGVTGLREYFSPYFALRKAFLLPPLKDPAPFLYDIRRVVAGRFRKTTGQVNDQDA